MNYTQSHLNAHCLCSLKAIPVLKGHSWHTYISYWGPRLYSLGSYKHIHFSGEKQNKIFHPVAQFSPSTKGGFMLPSFVRNFEIRSWEKLLSTELLLFATGLYGKRSRTLSFYSPLSNYTFYSPLLGQNPASNQMREVIGIEANSTIWLITMEVSSTGLRFVWAALLTGSGPC